MVKYIIWLSLTVFLASVLTSCRNGIQTDNNTNEQNKEQVSLTVLVATEWLKEKQWQLIFDEYEKRTGNQLVIQSAPVNNYSDLVSTRLATKDSPDLLFYWGQAGAVRMLQPEKNLLDLNGEEIALRIHPTVTKYFLKSSGKLYGIPATGISVSGVIYNKKVFEDLSIEIPKTYDEFLAVCEKIKSAGITPIYEAGKEGWPLQLFTLSTMANIISKQPDLMEKINTRKTTFEQVPAFIDSLQKQLDLLKKGYLNSDLFTGTFNLSLEHVATGKSAMMFQADWAINPLMEKYPDATIGMFPMPWDGDNYPAISDPNGLYVFKNSKNVQAAKEFLEFFGSREILSKYFNEVKSIPTWTGLDVVLNEVTEEMYEYVESGRVVPFFNSLGLVEFGEYQSLLQEMYGGQITPVEVARALQKNVDRNSKAAGLSGF
ncbi:hypothetical protein BK133_01305 [Paenibacillus sp. FSL H8-0548]|uniref:ABC transporter substrate-binding protein n=1 Tax=Paenibacillus sp. FSL H8-0548 TaxID=1920422 RepID=UPI00096C3353|nr:extracellular solute-binding protein [Paenibacillus sp. FSL H8-0548]OMF38866.1 hypothetical protein BK133_01305 [Paenibacillus sp. FSL H8-0548]